MTTIYILDPVAALQPYAEERAVAEAVGAEFVLGDAEQPELRDAEIILTTQLPFPAESVRRLKRCRLIVRYGIGVDTIDLAAATECGIVVANAPSYCVSEVADHTAALILSFARRVPWLNRQVHLGSWQRVQKEIWGVRRLSCLTLGIVGLGKIGCQVAERMRPFGFRILGYDHARAEDASCVLGVTLAALDELLRESDIVSLHVPLTSETHHLIDEEKLRLMKPSATIVNTSRGAVIDEQALVRALQEQRLFGAALDVLAQEPPDPNHPLFQIDPLRVIVTPHFAAASLEVFPDLHREVSAAVAAVLAGRWPVGVVNREVVPKVALDGPAR